MAIFKKTSKKTDVPSGEETTAPRAKKVRAKKSESTTVLVNSKQGVAFRVLLKPILSEKAARLESHRSYAFMVTSRATKTEIRNAVSQVYGVTPHKIRTLRLEGKKVRFGSSMGKRKDWKKAIVTLKEGDSIRIHEGV